MLFKEGSFTWLRRVALSVFVFTGLLAFSQFTVVAAGNVTLTWNPSADSNVIGYRIYYGAASRNYTNVVDVGGATNVTISNLVEGVTYYFAATAYNVLGMESDYSGEISYTVPSTAVNQAPTLNALGNVTLNEGAGLQTVNLTGISTGASNEVQTLTVSAVSSNPGLIPNPAVTYVSPNATGTLSFTPVALGNGVATITVTVNDGGASNNVVTRSFTVTVNANTPPTITIITNQTIATNATAGPIPFAIGDAETSASNLVVSATSSLPTLIPTNNILFGGSDSNRTVTLTPLANQSGTADITVTVSDGIATASTTFQLAVLGPPSAPSMLTVVTNGSGTVTPNLSAQSLVVGKTYTLTATPGPDQLFAGWSGSVASSSASISFLMQSNLLIQANFVPNPFVPGGGSYNGLFYETDAVRLNSAGAFWITVSTRGTYSGRLQLGRSRYSFRGQFNLQSQATNQIPRLGTNALTLELNIGGNQGDEISGRLTDGNWVSSLGAKRSAYNARLNPAPQAGNYTMILPGQTNDPTVPMGTGYGTVRVYANGVARFAGALADGTKISQSALLSPDGQWPLYAPLYSGYGLVMSWMTITNLPQSDLNGALSWIKPPNVRTRYYPGGFTNEYEAVGSAYVAPLGTNQVLNFGNSYMDFIGGNLATNISTPIVVGPRNYQASGTNLTMKFSLSSGMFYGKTLDPATRKWSSFGGALLQKVNAGYGYLLGTNQSSQVILTP